MAQGFRDGHGNGGDPLKTLALFDRHFCGKDTRFGLLQLLRGDAPLNAIRPLLFDHNVDAQLTSRFFQVLSCHIGMGNPGRTGGDADDGWCIHQCGNLVFLRATVQRIKQILRRRCSHNAFPECIICQARRQRRQYLDMRGSGFSRRDGKQDDQLNVFRAVHPLPLQRFAQRSNRKSRFVHRARFTMRNSQPFPECGRSL